MHACVWTESGTATDVHALGETSVAMSINACGHVVGTVKVRGGNRAFLHACGRMFDLNALIAGGSGWVLESAYGITADGKIVGHAVRDGEFRGFVLTPRR